MKYCVHWPQVFNLHTVHNVSLQILFVETHRGYDGTRGPVDHDICE